MRRHPQIAGVIDIDHRYHTSPPLDVGNEDGTLSELQRQQTGIPRIWRDSAQRAFATKVAAGLRNAGQKVRFTKYLAASTPKSIWGLPADDISKKDVAIPNPDYVNIKKLTRPMGTMGKSITFGQLQELRKKVRYIEGIAGPKPIQALPTLLAKPVPRPPEFMDEGFVETQKRGPGMGRKRRQPNRLF